MHTSPTKRAGSALIEIALVVTILGVITAVAIPMYRKYQIRGDLTNASAMITQGVARARVLAQSGEGDSPWGFSMEHATLFKGASYEERDPAYDELYPIPVSIEQEGTTEIWFQKISGAPNAPGSIVTLIGNDGEERTINLEVDAAGALVSKIDLMPICHQPNTPSRQTIYVNDAQLANYLAQGDTQGACPPSSSSSSAMSSSSSAGAASSSSSFHSSSVAASAGGMSSSSSSSFHSSSSAAGGGGGASSSSSTPIAISTKGIYLLATSGLGALNVSGNGHLTVTNGTVRINSSNSAAMYLDGNAIVTSPTYYTAGSPGYTVANQNAHLYGTVTGGSPLTADPLATLPVPTPAAQQLSTVTVAGNTNTLLGPNTYQGISVSANARLTLNPGTYYLNGGLSVSGNGQLTGSGVTIYVTNGSISFSGNGNITLKPPSSGTYAGVTVFQNRTSTSTFDLSGNGILSLKGVLYAAAANFSVTGNGSSNVIGSLVIGKTLTLSGNGTFNVQ